MPQSRAPDPIWLVGRMDNGAAAVEVLVWKLERKVQIAFHIPGADQPLAFNFDPAQAEEISKMLKGGADFFKL